MLGELARPGGRDLAERAHAAGHWIGNHTLTHSVMFGDSDDPSLPDREIGEAQALIGDLAHPDRLFRPYGGGGVIGPRLLSAAAVATSSAAATSASGTASRATGTPTPPGPTAASPTSRPTTGRSSSPTTCRPAAWRICPRCCSG